MDIALLCFQTFLACKNNPRAKYFLVLFLKGHLVNQCFHLYNVHVLKGIGQLKQLLFGRLIFFKISF